MDKLQNITLKVVGVTFTNEDTGTPRQQIISQCTKDTAVFLEREPTNKYDKNAVKVITLMGQVGYIGKDYASILSEMMDTGRKFTAAIADVGLYKKNWYMQVTINEV